MYPYQVSVIMAVYNVEPFLSEAIDSVIHQTIGFQNIQLILVNDGSTDGSGVICDGYAARYPENIRVIHKKNGGVSSARNEGLKHATGKYLNFMDADDTLSDNVCSKVVEFFDKHYRDLDAVAFPMYFFDGKTGPHILNNKFSKGSRVIDLRKEFDLVQLSTASAFLKAETVKRLHLSYDTHLMFTEDAKFLVPLLCETMRLGVVSTCRYRVRRRSLSSPSATQQSAARKEWWLDTLLHFQMDTIRYCLHRFGFLPRYVQYLLSYDLQWRLQQSDFPHGLLSDTEISKYRDTLSQVLAYIDDEILWAQKSIWREHKVFAMKLKYGREPELCRTCENVQFYYGEKEVYSLMDHALNLSFLRFRNGFFRIEGFLMLCTPGLDGICVEARTESKTYPCNPIPGPKLTRILGENAQKSYGFSVDIPLDEIGKDTEIRFAAIYGDSNVLFHQFRLGKHFPITTQLAASYYHRDGISVVCRKNAVILSRCGCLSFAKAEIRLLRELFRKNHPGMRKAIAARIIRNLLRPLKRKPLLILSDRITRGGDNGEAMFRYLRTHHRRDVHAVFAVSRNSGDFAALRKIGPVVDAQSHLHKLLHLVCDCNLSSSAEVHTINPFTGIDAAYRDILSDIQFVFLQHGITKDDISGWINRYDKNIHGIVTAAQMEHDSFLDDRYGFPSESIWLTGFPRFDRLYRNEQKRITIMPTWRKDLMGTLNSRTGLWSVSPDFYQSDFLVFYRTLLNHPRLHRALRKYGYSLCFFPHPNFMGIVSEFHAPDGVEIPDTDTPYRDLYAETDLIVTDYSSAVFDFAYLRKPVVYCQFDADSFFSGSHSYRKGYFDYHLHGFGAVASTLEETVGLLISHMASGCSMEPRYRARADSFFAYDDQDNCRRVYEKVMELLNP